MQCYEVKANGEKFLRVYLTHYDGIIEKVILSGDFFITPEEGIDLIESSLVGIDVRAASIIDAINEITSLHNIELIGISSQSIAHAIVCASEL